MGRLPPLSERCRSLHRGQALLAVGPTKDLEAPLGLHRRRLEGVDHPVEAILHDPGVGDGRRDEAHEVFPHVRCVLAEAHEVGAGEDAVGTAVNEAPAGEALGHALVVRRTQHEADRGAVQGLVALDHADHLVPALVEQVAGRLDGQAVGLDGLDAELDEEVVCDGLVGGGGDGKGHSPKVVECGGLAAG